MAQGKSRTLMTRASFTRAFDESCFYIIRNILQISCRVGRTIVLQRDECRQTSQLGGWMMVDTSNQSSTKQSSNSKPVFADSNYEDDSD
jgi:hypothetical protein